MFQLFWTKNHSKCEKLISTSAEERKYCGRQSAIYSKTSSRPLTSNFCVTVKWPGDETCRHTHIYVPFPSCILFTKHVTQIWKIW